MRARGSVCALSVVQVRRQPTGALSQQPTLQKQKLKDETYHEGIQDADSHPKAPPHGIDHRHQRVSRFESFDTSNELGKSYLRRQQRGHKMSATC